MNGRITMIEDSELLPDIQLRDRLLRVCTETPEIQLAHSTIIKDHKYTNTEIDDVSVLIWISFVEIYNENVNDLFAPAPIEKQKMAPHTRINLRLMDNNGKVFIRGVTLVYVKSSVALHLLHSGLQHVCLWNLRVNYISERELSLIYFTQRFHRIVFVFKSSRSHCIFLIDVLRFYRSGRYEEFCDLAGSKRGHKTDNISSRFKKSQRITTSLLVLGRCLDAATSTQEIQRYFTVS